MSEQFPYSFGKYRMEAEIGRGGFGAVFRAMDVDLDRPVAIKIMDPIYMRDTRWVARFRREARVMAQLDHPHIVPIYEIGEVEGRLYLAMKLIDGPDLTQMIAERGALPWDVVVGITAQIASALDFAHQHNVIHRDLKPGNILVSDGQAVLTDFGLAQMMESNSQSISVSGGFTGTYNYMPPEVFNNEAATPASDVYALGCVLYEMLTGQMLFDGQTTAAIIGAHLKGISFDEPLPEGTPSGTREILQIAVAKDPLDRYASATLLAQELQRVATDRLAAPYVKLEQAVAGQHWAEALALAAEIRTQEPNYRDTAALEARAQRGKWSEKWRLEAQQALTGDHFDVVRGALIQWRRVDPDNPEIARFEQDLGLAEQYVVVQALVAGGEWKAAQTVAKKIYTQDPAFRDIATLQAKINANIEPPPEAVVATAVTDMPQDEQDPSAAEAALVGAAALGRHETTHAAAPASVAEKKAQESAPASPATGTTVPRKKGTGVPAWVWWVGAIAVVLLLVFGIRAMISGADSVSPEATEESAGSIAAVIPTATLSPTATAGSGGGMPEATEENGEIITAFNPTATATITAIPPTLTAMATPEPTNTPTSAPSPTATLDPKVRPLDPTLGSVWDRPKDEMGMVYVPAGPFSMGSDEGYSDMLPIHDVTLDGFWIDRMEVNNDQFAEFVSGTGYRTTAEETGRGVIITESGAFEDTRGADWQHPQGPESDLRSLGNHPVVLVSWYDARAYCEWAGGILPTEAQWEYAARGPEGLEYPWGENFDGEKANYCDISCGFDWKDEAYDDGYARTAPVGIYPEGASWTGTLDMAGNVWEWVNDWYDSKYYADVAAENPMGPVSGQLKVLRGGGWFQPSISDPQMDLRSAYRLESFPEYRNDHLGFRCVLPGR